MTSFRNASFLVMIALATGCVSTVPRQGRPDIAAELRERTGHDLGPAPTPAAPPTLPPDVDRGDGISRSEAVALALWSNPSYQATLAELGLAHADLVEAGLLSNPVLSLLFPWGPKQFEASVRWPIEAFWLRPRRVSIAHLNVEQVASRLVDSGLALARDAKAAHADLVLATDDARLAAELAALQAELAGLTAARLRAGDVSGLEEVRARAGALQAEEEAARSASAELAAKERLAALLGLPADAIELESARPATVPTADTGVDRRATTAAAALERQAALPGLDELLADALAARPDVRAAELAIDAAGQRIGLAEAEYWTITAAIDANEAGSEGFEAGPGIDLAIPAFDRNQGKLSAAGATLQIAALRYLAIRNDVTLAVRSAHTEYLAARQALDAWRARILPALEDAARYTERALAVGEVSYLELVTARIFLTQSRRRGAAATADLARAEANLEKAVGRALFDPPSGAR